MSNPSADTPQSRNPLDFRPGAMRARSDSVESVPQVTPTMGGKSASAASAAGAGNAGGIYRQAPGGKTLVGRLPRQPDPRKFRYDVLQGRSSTKLGFVVTRDDRMSADEAGAALHGIHQMCGVESEDPEILYVFDQALWFFHTVNGGSVLNPGRALFSVDGVSVSFNYFEIRNKLGVDVRRFFRAFADDIKEANKAVLAAYDPSDFKSVEYHGWLMEVATERGMSRYPYLAHDSADACTELNQNERLALINSKAMVLGATVNSADRARQTSRVVGPDAYDSTTGTKI